MRVWSKDRTYHHYGLNKSYTVYKRLISGKFIYNLTDTGRGPDNNAGGYHSIQPLLKLKGLVRI